MAPNAVKNAASAVGFYGTAGLIVPATVLFGVAKLLVATATLNPKKAGEGLATVVVGPLVAAAGALACGGDIFEIWQW